MFFSLVSDSLCYSLFSSKSFLIEGECEDLEDVDFAALEAEAEALSV